MWSALSLFATFAVVLASNPAAVSAVRTSMTPDATLPTNPPLPPPALFLNDLEYVGTEVNIPEGYSMDCHVAINKYAGAMMTNCSSVNGWSARYIRNDLGNLSVHVYTIGDDVQCYTHHFPEPVPIYPPFFNYYGYVRDSVFMGEQVKEFHWNANRYTRTLLTHHNKSTNNQDAKMWTYACAATIHALMSKWEVEALGGGASNPVFDLPQACNNPIGDGRQEAGRSGSRKNKHPSAPAVEEELLNTVSDTSPQRTLKQQKKEDSSHDDQAALFLEHQSLFPLAHSKMPWVDEMGAAMRAERKRRVAVERNLAVDTVRSSTTSVDNSKFATPVRLQGSCGACWAFSTAAATEIIWNKAVYDAGNSSAAVVDTSRSAWLSTQYLIDCVHGCNDHTAPIHTKGCQGGWSSTAFEKILRHGVVYDTQYPYTGVTGTNCLAPSTAAINSKIYPIQSYTQLPFMNVSAMEEAIDTHGAITVGLTFPLSLTFFNSGPGLTDPVFMAPENSPYCVGEGHFMTLVGYGVATNPDNNNQEVPYWLVKNSFGTQWATAGYARVQKGVNLCGIEENAVVAAANQTAVREYLSSV